MEREKKTKRCKFWYLHRFEPVKGSPFYRCRKCGLRYRPPENSIPLLVDKNDKRFKREIEYLQETGGRMLTRRFDYGDYVEDKFVSIDE